MKVIITAPRGKMGRLIVKEAAESKDIEIVGIIGPKGRDYIGKDAGQVALLGYDLGIKITDSISNVIDKCDVIIDFSEVSLSMEVLKLAKAHKKAVICGTTGFNEAELEEFKTAASEISVMQTSNTSYVVNLMKNLLAIAAKALEERADIEIIEMHDAQKKDAPSGTSKEMAMSMAEAISKDSYDDFVKFHSVRAGDISSSHTVLFGCMGERLEITHHAYNWECFAKGACDGARYLSNKSSGLYSMKDIINS